MSKTYNPAEFEKRIYDNWINKGYFKATPNPEKVPFTIVIPPPNITGQLHMGHAMNNTLQDIIIRYKRMKGFETLWLPGTDHASIATEVKIVEQIKAEGQTKEAIGREGFLERAWKWKAQYGGRIVEQLKRLGSSCDWSREAFTMDERCSKAVKKVFVDLYNKGLIYQGNRIINWCPSCHTALSDAEVEYDEKASHLWHVKYPVKDLNLYLTVATTRPETIPGDTAVAVNPGDKRYAHLIGKSVLLPILNREIPIIQDDYVSMEFGTGAVKITPAHDPNDFEVGLRHNLPVIKIMDDSSIMNADSGYEGQDRYTARKNIVNDLSKLGLIEKIEDYKHNVGECYRCNTVVEPIISKQWFVKMKPLAGPAIKVVKEKKIEFIPERFTKVYYNWMENIKDWCISRQLWWGHRIPAYYCGDCGNVIVSMDALAKCSKCGSSNLRQDEDVLDTWFSSALWPFSTLGYPDKNKDLEYFYPTNVLVTAYDIIFFWVARMIFSGLEHMKEIPFSEVLIHGIVRDADGKKMSKSLGNGIDPIEIIDTYGADTLRFSLAMGIAPGGDTRFSYEKAESCRNFMNKIWNASRFVLMNLDDAELPEMGTFRLNSADKWILNRLNRIISEVTRNLEKYEIGQAAGKLYDFVWNEFCDWYIELTKPALYSGNIKTKNNALAVLVHTLKEILKLLHPFIPFITEEIYSHLDNNSVMISEWPMPVKKFNNNKEAAAFTGVMDIIKSIRNIRAELNVLPARRVKALIYPHCDIGVLSKSSIFIKKLAGVSEIEFINHKGATDEKCVTAVTSLAEVFIPLGDLVDIEKELERLNKEYADNEKEIARSESMLSNERFVLKAPKEVVNAEREKLQNYINIKKRLIERIETLK
ncbi:MAG: valine--tRNA ligase [Christensenellales bacterium]